MLSAVLRPSVWPYVAPVVLLIASNVFMTYAWYWHLKYKAMALWLVVLISWSVALIEYCFAVPANRIGHSVYSAAQLKTIQEVIALTIFAGFSALYLKESLSWGTLAGFALIAAGAALVFKG
jgi:uncharacterized protein (DUF486 family)